MACGKRGVKIGGIYSAEAAHAYIHLAFCGT